MIDGVRRAAVVVLTVSSVLAGCSSAPASEAPSVTATPVATPAPTPRPTHPPEPTPFPRATLGNFDSAVSELERLGLTCQPLDRDDGPQVCTDAATAVLLLLTPSSRRPDQLEEYVGNVDLSQAGAPESEGAFVAALSLLEAIAEGSGTFVTDALFEDRSLSLDQNLGQARLEVIVRASERELTFRLAGREIVN